MKSKLLIAVLLLASTALAQNPAESLPSAGLVCGINLASENETTLRACIDAMVADGLRDAGYLFVGPDASWSSGRNVVTGHLTIDATKWPDGIQGGLCDYAHARGMKCNLYFAATRASVTHGCAGFPTSNGHEATDMGDAAAWGVDFIRADGACNQDFTPGGEQAVYQALGTAIAGTGRSMIFSEAVSDLNALGSLSWCATTYGTDLIKSDGGTGVYTWAGLMTLVDGQFGLQGPFNGCWNYPWFMEIASPAASQPMNLTDTEAQTNFDLWAIFGSPMFANLNPSDAANAGRVTMLQNAKVLAVDRDSAKYTGGRQTSTACGSDLCQVFTKQLANGSWAVDFVNRSSTTQSISATWAGLSIPVIPYNGCDLWAGTACPNLGALATGYTASSIPSHGDVMIRLDMPNETLTVALAGTGSGSVTSSDSVINCGVACTDTVVWGTEVSITAHPHSTSTFTSYSGCGCGVGNPCIVTVTANCTATATFALNHFAGVGLAPDLKLTSGVKIQ